MKLGAHSAYNPYLDLDRTLVPRCMQGMFGTAGTVGTASTGTGLQVCTARCTLGSAAVRTLAQEKVRTLAQGTAGRMTAAQATHTAEGTEYEPAAVPRKTCAAEWTGEAQVVRRVRRIRYDPDWFDRAVRRKTSRAVCPLRAGKSSYRARSWDRLAALAVS